jgi:DNA-binding NtrC family response regulator
VQPRFLLIDDNRDGRSVIARAVQRKYRDDTLREFPTFAAARPALVELGTDPDNWIVLGGRTTEYETVALVAAIRAAHRRVPLIALGRPEEAFASLAAGATHFLAYEAWLLLGVMVERVTSGWAAPRPAS